MNNLFILPFDHRSSFARDTIGAQYPVNITQTKKLISLKKVIFDGFLLARKQYQHPEEMIILADEEFGTQILKDAERKGVDAAQTVEKSGTDIFELEHAVGFRGHLKKYDAEFAKVLIHFPARNKQANAQQNQRILKIQKFCRANELEFILEVLVDKEKTFESTKKALQSLKRAGIKPDIWKLEAMPTMKAWKEIRKIAGAPIVMLGHGANKKTVEEWLQVAAKSGAVHGIAIGRTIFLKPIQDFLAKKIDRKTAKEKIAKNYLHFIKIWNKYHKE